MTRQGLQMGNAIEGGKRVYTKKLDPTEDPLRFYVDLPQEIKEKNITIAVGFPDTVLPDTSSNLFFCLDTLGHTSFDQVL